MSIVDQAKNAAEFIEDETHEAHFDKLIWRLRQKRDEAASQVPEWEQLRDLASAIKEHTDQEHAPFAFSYGCPS